jgi:hypothetical protein
MDGDRGSDGPRTPARFDRLRDYCRNGRAPLRREGERLIFLTTRDADEAPDVRVSRGAFAETLRHRFSTELTGEATKGLASRAPQDSARRVLTESQKRAMAFAAFLVVGAAAAAPKLTAITAYIAIAVLFAIMDRAGGDRRRASTPASTPPARRRRSSDGDDSCSAFP